MKNKLGFRLYNSDNADSQNKDESSNSNSDFEQFFEFIGIGTRNKKKKKKNKTDQLTRSHSTQSLSRSRASHRHNTPDTTPSTNDKSSTSTPIPTINFGASKSSPLPPHAIAGMDRSKTTTNVLTKSGITKQENGNKNNNNNNNPKRKSLLSLKKSLEQKKLSLACERGDIQSLRSIINKYRDKRKNTKLLRSLLEFEDTDNNNRTALIYCIMGNNVECLLELLRNNVNLEHYVSGSTPLYHATSRGFMECVEELLIYGANPNAINVKGWTALMNAAYFGHRKIVELLLKYGADPDIQRTGYDDKCALHFASKNGRYRVVQLLLEYGADTNLYESHRKMTSLMFAVKYGYHHIAQSLILHGANPYLKNKNGKCAIDFIQTAQSSKEAQRQEQRRQKRQSHLMQAESAGAAGGGGGGIPLSRSVSLNDVDSNSNSNSNSKSRRRGNSKSEEECLRQQQREELFVFMQQSTHIYNGINRLIVTDTMRKIVKSLRKIDHEFPPIVAQLRSVSHMYQLGQSELDIHHFNNVVCAQLAADVLALDPMSVSMMEDEPLSRNQRHEKVLDSFRNDVVLCSSNRDRCEENLATARKCMQQIESDLWQSKTRQIEIATQIEALQRELELSKNRQQQLENQQVSQKKLMENYEISLKDSRHEMEMKQKVCLLMEEASNNIQTVCRKAQNVPLDHRKELNKEYKKKRKMLEESWNLWNLDDVITWICSLEPSGKFHKYKDNLRKLKYLEEPAHGKKRSKKDVQFGNRLRKFKGKTPPTMTTGSGLITEQMLMNRLNDRESDEYDADSANYKSEEDCDFMIDDAVNHSKSPDIATTSKCSSDPPDIEAEEEEEEEEDMEGKHDTASGLSADSGDDHRDHGLVAIADPQSPIVPIAPNDHHIALGIAASMKAMTSKEGQYHVHYSDSEQSNNDKHGANEVVFQALMPHKSSDEDEDDPVLKSIDVEKLLDTMDNEILSNMFDRATKGKNASNDLGKLQRSHPKKGIYRRRNSNSGLRQDFGGNQGDNGSTTSSSPALSDESYSGPDEPILDSINSSVLKICGIRNAKDRKMMMDHIESLRNGQLPSYIDSAVEEEEMEQQNDQRLVIKVESADDDNDDFKERGDGGGIDDQYGMDIIEEDSDDGNTEISMMGDDFAVDEEEEDPTEYLCPITKQLMSDPVICSDGHSYERQAIEDWLLSHDKSPMTNATLETKQLFPNHSLRSMIAEYRVR